jgi:hypothetical protein
MERVIKSMPAAKAIGLGIGKILKRFPPEVSIDDESHDWMVLQDEVTKIRKRSGMTRSLRKTTRIGLDQFLVPRVTVTSQVPSLSEQRLASMESELTQLRKRLTYQALSERYEPDPVRLGFGPGRPLPADPCAVYDYLIGMMLLCRMHHKDPGGRKDRIALIERREGEYLVGQQVGSRVSEFRVKGSTLTRYMGHNYIIIRRPGESRIWIRGE